MNIFSFRYQAGMLAVLMDQNKGDGGGGGSGAGGGDGKGAGGSGDGKGSGAGGGDEIAALRAANKALEERLAKIEAAGKGAAGDDPDLKEKAEAERKAKEQKDRDSKAIESALRFSMGAAEWLKTNESLLPKDLKDIFDQAEKENYGSSTEKADAIKSAVIQKFFQVQANLDLLTLSQKSALEDFLKLTKNGKQEKAAQIYDTIFEPTFEMLKRVKKAEQLNKDGHVNSSDVDKAYRDKMMNLSRKHYMGEKANA